MVASRSAFSKLAAEKQAAANIRSADARKAVVNTLGSVMQRLKAMYKSSYVLKNGLVIFAGHNVSFVQER